MDEADRYHARKALAMLGHVTQLTEAETQEIENKLAELKNAGKADTTSDGKKRAPRPA